MKYEVQINNEKEIISCNLEGDLDIEESISLSKSLREKATELGFNVFYDAQKLCKPTNIMSVYDFSTQLSSILDIPAHRNIKVAFLYKPGYFDDYWEFYENVAVNRGLLIKVFVKKDEAMKWLAN